MPSYLGCWIETKKLLEAFPRPNVAPQVKTFRQFGGTILTEGDDFRDLQEKPRRGRPKAGNGMVEVAVRIEFRRRAEEGQLPKKKEAIIQDCIDWIRQTFGHESSRSTVQRYLEGAIEIAQK